MHHGLTIQNLFYLIWFNINIFYMLVKIISFQGVWKMMGLFPKVLYKIQLAYWDRPITLPIYLSSLYNPNQNINSTNILIVITFFLKIGYRRQGQCIINRSKYEITIEVYTTYFICFQMIWDFLILNLI